MNRLGSLLTGLMLLAAQVPWVACPAAEANAFFPALGAESVHEHVRDGHLDGHRHHGCRGHHHGHAHRPAATHAPDCPTAAPLDHVHGVLSTQLVVDAGRVELPAPHVSQALFALPCACEVTARPAHAAALEPPPPRPPSAACLEDDVRLLS